MLIRLLLIPDIGPNHIFIQSRVKLKSCVWREVERVAYPVD